MPAAANTSNAIDASIPTAEPRDAYTTFWNDVLVPKFERFRNIMMTGLSLHSAIPLGALALPPGSRAIDVGCGWGDTALELARKVGPGGSVLGLDCCDAFLEKGRADAAAEGLAHVRFVGADVETYPFTPEFDFAFSRFGTMFFANPVAAMRNVRRALKPGATFMFIAWRPIGDNPWLGMPKEVVSRYLPPPGENAQTCGPGPFSMADPDTVAAQLRAAGFEVLDHVRVDGEVMIGSDLAQAVDFQLALGPAGEIFREAGPIAEKRREEIDAALRSALAPYAREDGVRMMSSSWTYTACNPR